MLSGHCGLAGPGTARGTFLQADPRAVQDHEVRQSSRQQVLEHSESTRLQYGLADRAVALGWARSQVVVIDDDLGVSAATADSRKGFARLVTEVTMGRAGVVLGIEMSRLARTGRDWHQLLELCSLSGVLLADPDGVYDPGACNHRLRWA